MENRRRKNSGSGDIFSFPVIIPPAQDSDQFEFGCVTKPGSPNSPADHLFSNGKLLPHAFPIQTPNYTNFSYSRSTSRTSSISSKDSLMSSRSNSTNSRSSSARTSTSEASERKLSSADGTVPRRMSETKERNKPVLSCQYHQYGSSQRWQLIAAAPVLKTQGSRSRSRKVESNLDRKGSKKIDGGAKSWFGKSILKLFVSACKECHAIKT